MLKEWLLVASSVWTASDPVRDEGFFRFRRGVNDAGWNNRIGRFFWRGDDFRWGRQGRDVRSRLHNRQNRGSLGVWFHILICDACIGAVATDKEGGGVFGDASYGIFRIAILRILSGQSLAQGNTECFGIVFKPVIELPIFNFGGLRRLILRLQCARPVLRSGSTHRCHWRVRIRLPGR